MPPDGGRLRVGGPALADRGSAEAPREGGVLALLCPFAPLASCSQREDGVLALLCPSCQSLPATLPPTPPAPQTYLCSVEVAGAVAVVCLAAVSAGEACLARARCLGAGVILAGGTRGPPGGCRLVARVRAAARRGVSEAGEAAGANALRLGAAGGRGGVAAGAGRGVGGGVPAVDATAQQAAGVVASGRRLSAPPDLYTPPDLHPQIHIPDLHPRSIPQIFSPRSIP